MSSAAEPADAEPAAALRLVDLPSDRPATVAALTGDGLLRERLVELGFVPGVAVTVLRRAAFGGPLQVRVRGGTIALRRDEAECVTTCAAPADALVRPPQPHVEGVAV